MQKNYDLWIKFTPKEHFWHETKKNPIVINKQVRPRSFILLNKKLKLPEITNKTTNNPSNQKKWRKIPGGSPVREFRRTSNRTNQCRSKKDMIFGSKEEEEGIGEGRVTGNRESLGERWKELGKLGKNGDRKIKNKK